MKKILVVDDEPSMRQLLEIMLGKEGYQVFVADSRLAAANCLAQRAVDLVITDVRLPDGDGIEILRHIRSASPETAVVVMTAFGSTATAVAAMKLGAHDYLVKPFDIEELKIVVRSAIEKQRLQEENRLLKAERRDQQGLSRIIGVSEPMTTLFTAIRSIAPTNSTVLVTGESGTGKELVARSLHVLSPRCDAPFVSVNCVALPETLLESELFGHMKGAFTDAHQNKKGLFEAAHRGTLFLDEVSEMPPAMQAKLLRALQERRIRRVGGTEEIEIDVRVIAATNQPLAALVQERRFREDLYYRLNVIPLALPPLRERHGDVPILAQHFLARFSEEMGKTLAGDLVKDLDQLADYRWPGNVRELENLMERAVALQTSPLRLLNKDGPSAQLQTEDELRDGFSLDLHLLEIEAALLRRALRQARGNRAEACRLLGITSRSLRYLLNKHGLAGELAQSIG